MKTSSEYNKLLNEEIEKRIAEMESPGYEFPDRFSKKDYIFTVIVGVVCLIGIIIGAFL